MQRKLADAAIIKQFVQDMPGQMKMFKEDQEDRAAQLMQTADIPAGYEIRPKVRKSLLQCYVADDIKETIKGYAEEEGISVNEYMNALLLSYIEVKRSAGKN